MTALATHIEIATRKGWRDDDHCTGSFIEYDRDEFFAYAQCDACRLDMSFRLSELDPTRRAAGLIALADIPARYAPDLDSPTPEQELALNDLRAWARRDDLTPAPVLYGPPGTGKTHLMAHALRGLIRYRMTRAWFIGAGDLLADLKAAFSDDHAHRQILRKATTVPLLVLDDIGDWRGDSDWATDQIGSLIDERYRALLPVAGTCNYAPEMWEQVLGRRTASRLTELATPVRVGGRDLRRKGA